MIDKGYFLQGHLDDKGTTVITSDDMYQHYIEAEQSRKLREIETAKQEKETAINKATKYKNPINEVGVTQVYGLDDPTVLLEGTGLSRIREHSLTPDWLIQQLPKREQGFFRCMFAGKMAKRIYRLYELQ